MEFMYIIEYICSFMNMDEIYARNFARIVKKKYSDDV